MNSRLTKTASIMTDQETINELASKFEQHFATVSPGPTLESVLDAVANDESGQPIFTPVVRCYGTILATSRNGQTGYWPTGLHFAKGTSYSEASDVAEALSRELFGLSEREYNRIHIQAFGMK